MRAVVDTPRKPASMLSETAHVTEWTSTKIKLPLPRPNQISASGNSAIAGRGLNIAVMVSRKSVPIAKPTSSTSIELKARVGMMPLALIWFGLGAGSLIFVLVHSVMWAVSLNMLAGFRGVSTTARMVGRNYNLSGLRFVARILIPAAFPSILAGLKIGWAFAWRTLIAAELVFGVSSGQGGLGWYIFESKNQLDIPEVFAGLLTIILIGLAVENGVFRLIEARTVQRWGMQT